MIKVGILFGGPSREREVSFAGGRTVYDNLNKQIFEPVPVFIDSHLNFILLDWEYIYKGTIRDFYPPVDNVPGDRLPVQLYAESFNLLQAEVDENFINKVGKRIDPEELHKHIDIAFLALHGMFGEDGMIQSLLEMLKIPYTGSGVKASALGMDKSFQKMLMQKSGFEMPVFENLHKSTWRKIEDKQAWIKDQLTKLGLPLVIRPANQGSSIGVTILETDDLKKVEAAIDHAFFCKYIVAGDVQAMQQSELVSFMQQLADLRISCGFPLLANGTLCHTPDNLISLLKSKDADAKILLEGLHTEHTVVLESFIHGKEFSCIVIRNSDGTPCALPFTEIIKKSSVYDYKSKYLPGLSRKETPIRLPGEAIEKIRQECETLYKFLGFQTYARIDGFYTEEGKVFLNDPNTTSGMLPSSFFFHQAASIGLNPSEFLTYITETSLQERLAVGLYLDDAPLLMGRLAQKMLSRKSKVKALPKVAVIMGGSSFERHISLESGRNVYEKLASGGKYLPVPVFLTYEEQNMRFFEIPVHDLLKDNADDVRDALFSPKEHAVLDKIKAQCAGITERFVQREVIYEARELSPDDLKNRFDAVFIALHGRPGEDGTLQKLLESLELPYNGSGPESSALTIDKYDTLQLLAENGFYAAIQQVVDRETYLDDPVAVLQAVEQQFGFPHIVKPVDDGCSSAVMLIRSQGQLRHYLDLIFMLEPANESGLRQSLGLATNEEFPVKDRVLIESLTEKGDAIHFLEITCGLITNYNDRGELEYQIFEPSETLATGGVLSLAEKFLAGEGQNITPARLSYGNYSYEYVAAEVKKNLKAAAKIIGIEGYARIDAFVKIMPDGEVQTWIIEVNSLPGMTPATVIFHQAALLGYKPHDFIHSLLAFGIERQKRKQIQTTSNR